MCLVDSSTSVDLDSVEIGEKYQCASCNTKFRGIGKKVHCPSCDSTDLKKDLDWGLRSSCDPIVPMGQR